MAHYVPTMKELEDWIFDLQDNATCVEAIHSGTDEKYGILSLKVVIPETEDHDSYIKVMAVRISKEEGGYLVLHNCPQDPDNFYRNYFRDVLSERFPGVRIRAEKMQGGEWLV